jgi:DNA-binding beta-propeller fold protein YncE
MRTKIHRSAARRLTVALLGAGVAVALATLGGCSTAPTKELTRLVWPEPPDKARIEFVRSIVSDEDLGKDTTATQSLLKFLEGQKPAKNRIVTPMGIAISDDGNRMYVSDNSQAAIFVYDFAKKTSLKIGGEDKPLASPMQLALDAQENIYVVEQERKGITVFDREGKQLRFITDASIVRPTGIAIDSARNKIYVSDTSHGKTGDHTIKMFDLDGKFLGKLGKGKGDIEETFLFPTFLTVDAKGNLYIADTLNSRVQEFDAEGKFVKQIGKRGTAWGQFDKPKGVAVDSFGNVYVADSGWSNVQLFNPKGQPLLFFGGRGTYPGLLQNPTVVTIDKHNRIYVGDALNYRIDVYQLVNTSLEDSVAADETATKKVAAKQDDPSAKKDVSVQ